MFVAIAGSPEMDNPSPPGLWLESPSAADVCDWIDPDGDEGAPDQVLSGEKAHRLPEGARGSCLVLIWESGLYVALYETSPQPTRR